MSVFKEEATMIEEVAKQQKQIYSDAADYGVPIIYPDKDENVKKIKLALNLLSKSFKIKRKFENYETGKTSRTTVFIPWEQEGEFFCGTLYVIDYVHTKPKFKKRNDVDYISISCKRHSQKENPFLKN